MSRLRTLQVWIATVVLSTGLAVVPGMAEGSTQTFTGKVSDAMCGAKHTEGNLAPAACVRDCVQKGAKYALVVGDKVYTRIGWLACCAVADCVALVLPRSANKRRRSVRRSLRILLLRFT